MSCSGWRCYRSEMKAALKICLEYIIALKSAHLPLKFTTAFSSNEFNYNPMLFNPNKE